MEKLAPGVMWSFRFRALGISLIVFFTIFMYLFMRMFLTIYGKMHVIPFLFLSLFLIFIFSLILAEIYARLTYRNWGYEFDEHGIKIEKGIILKRYSNIPYERIQNVDILRGVLARMFGFSSVYIQTAGYSGIVGAEGTLPGVSPEKAEEIRQFLMTKISGKAGV